jgi:hypothetical protein
MFRETSRPSVEGALPQGPIAGNDPGTASDADCDGDTDPDTASETRAADDQ